MDSLENKDISARVIRIDQVIFLNEMMLGLREITPGIWIGPCHLDECIAKVSVQLHGLPGVVDVVLGFVIPCLSDLFRVELGAHDGIVFGFH